MRPTRESHGANQLLFPYLALLQAGFARHSHLWLRPWSLTPRFHPCPRHSRGRYRFCGTFRRITPPRRYRAPRFFGARTFLTRLRRARLFLLLSQALVYYTNVTLTLLTNKGLIHSPVVRCLLGNRYRMGMRLSHTGRCYSHELRLLPQFGQVRRAADSHTRS